MTAQQHELVAAVRTHAMQNYNEGGWDYVVECYSDEDIVEEIDGATTPAQAIKNVGRIVNVRDERRREATNEIF